MNIFSHEVPLISINLPYSHRWNTVVTPGLVPLVTTWQSQISYKNVYAVLFGTSFATLEPLVHCRNEASLSFFCKHYFGSSSCELAQLVPLPYSKGDVIIIRIDCKIFLSSFLDVTRMSMSTISLLTQLHSVKRFPVCFNLFVLIFFVIQCLVVTVQPCME